MVNDLREKNVHFYVIIDTHIKWELKALNLPLMINSKLYKNSTKTISLKLATFSFTNKQTNFVPFTKSMHTQNNNAYKSKEL